MQKKRKIQRQLGERRYRKMFVLAVEGEKTEPQYFDIFNHNPQSVIHVHCLRGKKSAPHQVLKRMKKHLREEGFKSGDEAWLVVDKDQWTDDQLNQLHMWAQESPNYGFALSNPKFEYWLLLHFEDGVGIISSQICTERLRKYLPDYNKGIDARNITQNQIANAIRRARKQDDPPCTDWPRTPGTTMVYRLVEKILVYPLF